MSTKTIKQRIAVVAISALTAGFFSVVTAPSANAAITAAAATTNGGSAVVDPAGTTSRSVGVLASGGTAASLTGTITMLETGTFVVSATTVGAATYAAMSVSGGLIVASAAEDTATNVTVNGTSTYIYGTAAAKKLAVGFKFAAGSTSMTVSVFANTAASTSSGTKTHQWVVTSATTSLSGAYSSATSKVNTVVIDASDATVDGVDETGSQQIANGGRGMINYILKDAYDVELGDTGAIVITASNGGLVAVNATVGTDTALASIVNTTAVTNDNTGSITVKQATANAPLTTTVTISYNGVVVGTKTITFEGEVSRVVVGSNLVSAAGGANQADQFRVTYFDSAGTRLYPSNDTSATTVVSSTLNQFITAVNVQTTGDSSTTVPALGRLTCGGTAATGAGAGSANLQLQYVNTSGTIVKSNVWAHSCAGNAVTYKASLDKATYRPGEIATLTVTALDAAGRPTHAAADNIAASGQLITIDGAPAATAITIPAATDVAGGRDSGNAAGTITYKYIVSGTEGSFQALVDAKEIVRDALGLASKQTVAYSVASGSVSNAEVLKSIVALIASINKQIQALQKLILRR
jgi:hypothetical protein